MYLRSVLTGLFLTATLGNLVWGQETPKVREGGPAIGQKPAAKSEGPRHHSNDQHLATCAAIDNQTEITLAQFAESHAQSGKVKQFAQMLVRDHQQWQQELEKFAPNAATPQQAQSNQAGAARSKIRQVAGTDADQQDQKRVQTAGGTNSSAPLDPLQLHRELAAQCLADSQEMLTKKGKEKFDACFVGTQIVAHAASISKLKVMRRHASEDLAKVLDAGLASSEQHLEKAEALMQEISDSSERENKKETTDATR